MQNFGEVIGYGFSSCRFEGHFASGPNCTFMCVVCQVTGFDTLGV